MPIVPFNVTLPPSCDLGQLGIAAELITSVEVICRRRINTVYRICCGGKWHVLKWIERPEMSVELLAYELLEQNGVPVLPYRAGKQALLLEDLAHSGTWRLADEADLARAEIGVAIALWYRRLHDVGRQLLANGAGGHIALHCEAEKVTTSSVRSLVPRLGLPEQTIYRAAELIEPIVQAARLRPQTLNYNDFDVSNLALHRTDTRRAIIFDYHLLGTGMAYSDYRNIITRLSGRAREAFGEAYGEVSEIEQALDAPIATLHALLQVAESPQQPVWAMRLVEQVHDGTLERQLREAMNAIQA